MAPAGTVSHPMACHMQKGSTVSHTTRKREVCLQGVKNQQGLLSHKSAVWTSSYSAVPCVRVPARYTKEALSATPLGSGRCACRMQGNKQGLVITSHLLLWICICDNPCQMQKGSTVVTPQGCRTCACRMERDAQGSKIHELP